MTEKEVIVVLVFYSYSEHCKLSPFGEKPHRRCGCIIHTIGVLLTDNCKDDNGYHLRSADSLDYSRTNIFKYSYVTRIVNEWNSLPNSVRKAGNVDSFKRMVTKFLNQENFNS